MRFLMLLMLLCVCSTLIKCRPSQLQEENSETGGGEYENDDSVDDEYLHEDESSIDEVPQKAIYHDGIVQNSEEQELTQGDKITPNKQFENKEGSESFTDNESSVKKELDVNNLNKLNYRGESFSVIKEHPNIYFEGTNSVAETEGSKSSRTDYQKNHIECKDMDERSLHLPSANSGDSLFKNRNFYNKNDRNDYIIGANVQNNVKKQYDNNRPLEHKAPKNYDYPFYNDRNRRHIENLEDKPVTDINTIQNDNNNLDISNENAILKNIKKLSEQDLEDLLNSLPEDKKALLKKIMEKREITKKAGAIEDNYLDQSDTSKIEGSYSINTNSISSLSSNSDITETSKQAESNDKLSTKVPDSESDPVKSENKSGEITDSSITEERLDITDTALKDEANINPDKKDALKSENKRETNQKDFTNENISLEKSIYNELKESSESKDCYEPKNEEFVAEKTDFSQYDPSYLSASVEKLEDSFPSASSYEDTGSDLEPLIRIKRTDLHHRVKKRDLPCLSDDNMSFVNDFDSEGSENSEKSGFINTVSISDQSKYAKNDVQGENDARDDNSMNNEGLRNNRVLSYNTNVNKNSVKLNRASRTIGPLNNENNLVLDNGIEAPNYQADEAFGSISENSEGDVNRCKRIKRLKNVTTR